MTRLVGIEAIENAIGALTMAGRVTWMGFALGDAARRIEGLSEFELRWPIDRDLVILEFLGSPSQPPREHSRKSFLSDNVGFHGLSPHHDDNVSVCVLSVLAALDTALTF
jgi:hypothetical protein